MNEHDIKATILRVFGIRPEIRLFNNPVGEAWMGKTVSQTNGQIVLRYPRRVRFGLIPGSSDLIGFRTVVVTPGMIGQHIAQFVAIETKAPVGQATEDQKNFLRVVAESGGVSILARGIDDVETGLDKPIVETSEDGWACHDRENCIHCPIRDLDCPFLKGASS